jgi:hypothetical protein
MQLSAQYRKAPPPAGVSETLQAAPAPAAGTDDDPPYLAAWLSYRRRLRYIWINGVLGFVGIAALVAILPRLGGETVLSALFPLWAMAWFAGMVIGMLRLVGFSCPRCGQTFFNPLVPPMSQLKCRACGLRKLHVDDHGTPLYRLLWARRRAGE